MDRLTTGIEMPIPVASATHAATHAGDLGTSARTADGTIHGAMLTERRVNLSGRVLLSAGALALA